MSHTRRKVFISYHHADKDEVNDFIDTFSNDRDVFITRALGAGMDQNIIDSTDTNYVMRRIRDLYLKDSTVTIVMIGKCTWARRYVDWEIQASLRNSDTIKPNGLLGVKLDSYDGEGYPNRLNNNLLQEDEDDCYARVIDCPKRKDKLINFIEDAFNARSNRKNHINNPRARFKHNRTC